MNTSVEVTRYVHVCSKGVCLWRSNSPGVSSSSVAGEFALGNHSSECPSELIYNSMFAMCRMGGNSHMPAIKNGTR